MNELAESVAHAFVRAINRQDVNALVALMTTEHRFTDSMGNVVEGCETMRGAWAKYFSMVPDYTVAIEETFCDGPVVVMLGMAQGTYSSDGTLRPENRWTTPTAFRAFIEEQKVAEWRVYCDNEPMRRLVAKSG
jgi:ketosteroid isomerase-like protein